MAHTHIETGSIVNLKATCLIYCPLPYNGRGPAQSCVSISENIPDSEFRKILFLPRSRAKIAPSVSVMQAISFPLNSMPWRAISKLGASLLDREFLKAIEASSRNSVAYFWPDPPLSLVRHARKHNILTIREMINTFRGTAKRILDNAYDKLGLAPTHSITDESIDREREELALYDFVFASNSAVEASLHEAGVSPEKIIPSSFGWSPERFKIPAVLPRRPRFTALFVGTISVRKGVPQLLEAWKQSGIQGELVLAGGVENALRPLLQTYTDNSVRILDFVSNVSELYCSADIFVFPTLEEGGPQVTYEAAGFGLPIITTTMGAGRIVKDNVNGLIVDPFDVDALAEALSRLAASPDVRSRLGGEAKNNAASFTYEKIGRDRGIALGKILRSRV